MAMQRAAKCSRHIDAFSTAVAQLNIAEPLERFGANRRPLRQFLISSNTAVKKILLVTHHSAKGDLIPFAYRQGSVIS
jgi:hypothetical protein